MPELKHRNHKSTPLGKETLGNGCTMQVSLEDTSDCPACQAERNKNEKHSQLIDSIIDTVEARKMYERLLNLISDLSDAGVDVSYFPDRAEIVLAKFAKELSEP